MTTGVRVDLNVPFAEKDHAKAHGARWDGARRTWYAPPGTDLGPLAPWMPADTPDPSPSDGDGPSGQKGVTLAAFLTRVRAAARRELPGAEWVRAEIHELGERNGNLYPELVEQNDRGDVLARARGFIWRDFAAATVSVQLEFKGPTSGTDKPIGGGSGPRSTPVDRPLRDHGGPVLRHGHVAPRRRGRPTRIC